MKPKLVLIEWMDAVSVSGPGWMRLSKIKRKSNDVMEDINVSVGFVVQETKDTVTLVSHLTGLRDFGDETEGSGDVTIPKAWVKHRVNLPYTPRPRI